MVTKLIVKVKIVMIIKTELKKKNPIIKGRKNAAKTKIVQFIK